MTNIPPSIWQVSGHSIPIQEVEQRLCEACRNGDVKMAEESLKSGANPNIQFRLALGEQTPLFLCSSKGYVDIAKLLINYRVDLKKKMEFDQTVCLHHAASNDQAEMCKFLIENGCNPNDVDRLGRTPLMDGAEIGSIRVIEVLLQKGASVNQLDNESHTALSYCLDFVSKKEPRFLESAIYLVRHGANPNYLGKFANRSILHCAAAHGDLNLVKELVEQYGASVLISDNDDKTAFNYAQEYGHAAVAEYLEAKRAEQQRNCSCIVM